MSSASVPARDLRLDFFRGLALLTIFVNHIPFDPLGEVTPRNFGFSDATEVFIFLSGFAASIAYGKVLARDGYLAAASRIAKRVWQLYVTHIFMLVLFCGIVAFVADRTGDATYIQEMFIGSVLTDPGHTLAAAPILGFQPAFMNILPMYIFILAMFIPMIALLRANRLAFLLVAVGIYAWAAINNINLPVYPDGIWYFNPLCWQVLFMLGALFGYQPAGATNWIPQGKAPLAIAVGYLTFSLIFVLSWRTPALDALMPQVLKNLIYPLSKTNLSIWRLMHFLATAYVALRFVPAGARWLRGPSVAPILACGRHALEVFCAGLLLSFAGRVIMLEVSKSTAMTFAVNGVGFTLLFSLAWLLDWYKAGSKTRKTAISERIDVPAGVQPPALDGLGLPAPQA